MSLDVLHDMPNNFATGCIEISNGRSTSLVKGPERLEQAFRTTLVLFKYFVVEKNLFCVPQDNMPVHANLTVSYKDKSTRAINGTALKILMGKFVRFWCRIF